MSEAQLVAGRYRVEASIGEGGMGRVYKAVDLRLERLVALKVLAKSQLASSHELLLREARASARLHHPNVVSVFDVGEHEGTPFLVMELAEGKSLRASIAGPPVRFGQKIAWVLDVARALEAAHAVGIIHRDIKPENVLVTSGGVAKGRRLRGRSPAPAIGDGGLVASLGWKLVGTPEYMSPEQIRGESVDARADQFAWGVVAYELLTGRLPFTGETLVDILTAVLTHEPVAPSSLVPVGAELDALVLRALAKPLEDRWASMTEIVAVLEPLAQRVAPNAAPSAAADAEKPTLDASTLEAASSRALSDTLPLPPNDTSAPAPMPGSAPVSVKAARRFTRLRVVSAVLLALVLCAGLYLAARGLRDVTEQRGSASAPEPARSVECAPEAAAQLKQGVALMRAGNWEQAHRRFEAATAADATCAPALLRLVMTGRSHYSATQERIVFQRARLSREGLDARDRDLLDAYEPLVAREPPDRVAFGERLRELTDKYPDDAEILTKFVFHAGMAPIAQRLQLARRATQVDPELSDSWQALGRMLSESGQSDPALDAYARCIDVAVGSTDCLAERIRERSAFGRCGEGIDDAKLWIARSPDTAGGYLWHAEALASLGKPRTSVEAIIAQRWSRLPAGDKRPLLERAKLHAYYGEFELALTQLDAHDAAIEQDSDLETHARSALLRFEIELELGQEVRALEESSRFFERAVAWSSNLTADAQQFSLVFFPPRTRVVAAAAARLVSPPDWFQQAGQDGTLNPLSNWALGSAMSARDPAEAQAALATSPVGDWSLALPTQLSKAARTTATLFEIGRVLALAGRRRDAIRFLRYASGACGAFAETLSSTQALALLGEELANEADKSGACAAFDQLASRWGQSPSRTVARARARASTLGCQP